MPHPHWPKRVADALKQRGVPAAYRRRLLAELGDHIDDMTQGRDTTMTDEILNARLGTPENLATHAATEYRKSRWTSRHPWFVFGLLPVPLTIFVLLVSMVLMGLMLSVCVEIFSTMTQEDVNRPAMVTAAYTYAWSLRFVPFLALAFFFTRRYLRSEVNRRWFVCAAVQVLFFAATMISTIHYSDTPGQSTMVLGFAWLAIPMDSGWQLPYLPLMGFAQVLQLIVPIAFALWLLRRHAESQPRCAYAAPLA